MRYFFPWDRPFLPQLVDWLWERREELSEMILVVPTAQSGRRVRQALAAKGGCWSPQVVTPGWFLGQVEGGRLEHVLAWSEILLEASREEIRTLIPVMPEKRSRGWSLAIAREIDRTRYALMEADLGFAEVVDQVEDPERWRELSLLEGRVVSYLRERHFVDIIASKRTHRAFLEGQKVVVAGVTDADPLTVRAWGDEPTILVHAPESFAETFDAHGRPLEEDWGGRNLSVSQEQITLRQSSQEAAQAVVNSIARAQISNEDLAVVACGETSELSGAFQRAGWTTFSPQGKRRSAGVEGSFLEQARGWVAKGDFRSFRKLLKNEWVLPHLAESSYDLASALDRVQAEYLPQHLKDLKRISNYDSGLEGIGRNERRREDAESIQKALTLFEEWGDLARFQNFKFFLEKVLPPQSALREEFAALEKVIQQLKLKGLDAKGEVLLIIDLLLESLRSQRLIADPAGSVLDLQSWLEVLYDPAPQVKVFDCHEGNLPDVNVEDGFLPDHLREKLGMQCRRSRIARDSYLLESLLQSREGRVEFFLSKVNRQADPQIPSPLLFRCDPSVLSTRVEKCFHLPMSAKTVSAAPWSRDWEFKASGEPFPSDWSLSPSALNDYLRCPFQFYLRRVEGMERHPQEKRELEATDFGSVMHRVLEDFGREESVRDSSNADEIMEFLESRLGRVMHGLYGQDWPLPLLLQEDSMRERLRQFSIVQAREREAGWKIKEVEWSFRRELPWSEGRKISVSVDRIDQHDSMGLRVIDYKTRGKAVSPQKSHWTSAREEEGLLAAAIPKEGRRGAQAWQNLQLPLYAAVVREVFGEMPALAYFQLPRALSEVKVDPWSGFDESHFDSALEWAQAVIQAINGQVFWPPRSQEIEEGEYQELVVGGSDR